MTRSAKAFAGGAVNSVKRGRGFGGWGLILLPLLLLAGCSHALKDAGDSDSKSAPLPVVSVAPVTIGTVLQTLPVTGSLSPLPNHEAQVNAPFAGTLAGIFVQPNQSVAKGQLVAQMSIQPLLGQIQQAQATIASARVQVQQARLNAAEQQATSQTAIAQARAQLASAQATFANAGENFAREQKLFQDGLVSKKDVDDSQLAVETAKATVDADRQAVAAANAATITDTVRKEDVAVAEQQVRNAQGQLATARAQIDLAQIHAAVSGTVATVTANSGETVDTSTALMTIVNTSDLALTVALPGANLSLVHPGQTVRFSADSVPGRGFLGSVASIGAQVDPVTGTVPVLVRIPNTSRLLKDDMQVTGQVVVARHPGALLVPKTAVLTDPGTNKASLVVVGPDDVAHVRDITTGLASGDKIEVTKGVSPGESVAVSGQYGLPDGTKVSIDHASGAGDGT